MCSRTLTNLVGLSFEGSVGEPWNFQSSVGENRLLGRVISTSSGEPGDQWLMCTVSPFRAGAVTITQVMIVPRYHRKEPLSLLNQGQKVVVHFLYDGTGNDIVSAQDFLADQSRPFLIGSIRFPDL